MTIVVFGSINMDFVAQVPRLPRSGETLLGDRFFTMAGGKGANQAVSVARLGGDCQMVGRVGDDPTGQELLQRLQSAGVDCSGIRRDPAASSGAAMIEVDHHGANHIVVIPGANGQLDDSDVKRLGSLLPQASWLLLQLEVPLQTVLSAAQAARAAGVKVMLDPAPAQSLPGEIYPYIDILTPNQTEAEQLTGIAVETPRDAAEAAHQLRRRGVSNVVITLGKGGAFYQSDIESLQIPAFAVDPVDTVAAGDTFNGALAVALSQQRSLKQAIHYSAAAAAIAVTREGAQDAIPTASEVENFISQHTGAPTLDRNL